MIGAAKSQKGLVTTRQRDDGYYEVAVDGYVWFCSRNMEHAQQFARSLNRLRAKPAGSVLRDALKRT